MRAIYEPRGHAREYAELACNLFNGCGHGCLYCYVPELRKVALSDHNIPGERPGILEALKRDSWELMVNRDNRRILLCFTCDPYPPVEDLIKITRRALEVLEGNKRSVAILTKAGYRATRDFDLLQGMDSEFGVSLSWGSDDLRERWEPWAARVQERIESLAKAKELGIRTWASVEPVIDPEEGLRAIELLLPVADVIKVGRWNHDPRADRIDWQSFARKAKALLERSGKKYLLKRGLAELV